jgi:hypothetical protein
MSVDIVVIVRGKRQLLQLVLALRSTGRFAGLLDSRQQERNQNGNDGNHYQQLNQRESASSGIWRQPVLAMHG